jgi:hypothetical protein
MKSPTAVRFWLQERKPSHRKNRRTTSARLALASWGQAAVQSAVLVNAIQFATASARRSNSGKQLAVHASPTNRHGSESEIVSEKVRNDSTTDLKERSTAIRAQVDSTTNLPSTVDSVPTCKANHPFRLLANCNHQFASSSACKSPIWTDLQRSSDKQQNGDDPVIIAVFLCRIAYRNVSGQI